MSVGRAGRAGQQRRGSGECKKAAAVHAAVHEGLPVLVVHRFSVVVLLMMKFVPLAEPICGTGANSGGTE